jgi:hypothetical protein
VDHLGMIFPSNAEVEAAIARVWAGGEVMRQGERDDCGVREVFAYVRDADGYVVELSTQEPLLRLAGLAPRVDVREAVPGEHAAAGNLIARTSVGAGWSPTEAADTLRDVESRLAGAELQVAVDAQCPVVVAPSISSPRPARITRQDRNGCRRCRSGRTPKPAAASLGRNARVASPLESRRWATTKAACRAPAGRGRCSTGA